MATSTPTITTNEEPRTTDRLRVMNASARRSPPLLFHYVLAGGKDPEGQAQEDRDQAREDLQAEDRWQHLPEHLRKALARRPVAQEGAEVGRQGEARQVAREVRHHLPDEDEQQTGDHRPLEQHAQE